VDSYKTWDKVKIPEKVKVMWHLLEGDFEYYKGTIDKIEFNMF
jgi:pheromone shutdown protein TraB